MSLIVAVGVGRCSANRAASWHQLDLRAPEAPLDRNPAVLTWRDRPVLQAWLSWCGPASIEAVLRDAGLTRSQTDIIALAGLDRWALALGGLSLDQLAEAMRAQGDVHVAVHRPRNLAQLHDWLNWQSAPGRRLIANFSRLPLSGESIGHHSPVLAWDVGTERLVIGDVTEGYGAWSVSPSLLLAAMTTVDTSTGQSRGLLAIEFPGDDTP